VSIEAEGEGALDIREVMRCLPHRYPFLLVDRILWRKGTGEAVGLKQLSINEEFFQGHFPGRPEMPFTLMLECMAQVGAAVVIASEGMQARHILFASADNCRFVRPAVPGESLHIHARLLNYRGDMGKMHLVCRSGDEELGSADLMFAMVDRIET
jgi:beta-hydroxyacyl-ACP dehydratase FabZ